MSSTISLLTFNRKLLSIGIAIAFGSGCAFGLGGKDARIPLKWISPPDKKGARFVYGPGDYGREIEFGGYTRFYEIHVPTSYDKSKPAPVVLVFHGGGGYPSAVRYQSGMDKVSNRNGFIAVYPAGSGKWFSDRLLIWNDGRAYKDGSSPGSDDVGFIAALLDDLPKWFNVDLKRVYACGISNGAQFTYRLAKELSGRIAAVAAIAGQRPARDGIVLPPSKPISVLQFSGKQDVWAPYQGGSPPAGGLFFKVKFETKLEPVEEVIRSWVDFNKCPTEPSEVKRIGKAVMTRYGLCNEGTEVELWTLEDGGHTWPGGKVFPSEIRIGVGTINRDISASDIIWDFFKKRRLK